MFSTFKRPKKNIFTTYCRQIIEEPEQILPTTDVELAHDNKLIRITKHRKEAISTIQYLPGEQLLIALGKRNKKDKIKKKKVKYNDSITKIENSMKNILKLF